MPPHALDRHGYLGGTDADRAADLTAALRDPGIRAVLCTRGGYGAQRIVDAVPFELLRDDPKLLVGFSDITALHLAAWRRAGIATCHGPGLAWDDSRLGAVSAYALHAVLTDPAAPVVITRDPAEVGASVLVPGVATGTLLGGNLSMLAASVGTPDLPPLAGCVLLVEEVDEPPYRIDRMLTQLLRCGALAGVAGVAVGQLTSCCDSAAAAVVAERVGGLGVPVLGGLPLGHGVGQLPVPLGTPAVLDADAGTLVVQPAVS